MKSLSRLGFLVWGLALVTVCFAQGCVTPAREREMRKDIFDLQTRLMRFEQINDEKEKQVASSGEVTTKRLASATSEVDQMRMEMQRIHGDIDALKVGVRQGQMPGTPEGQESIATTIKALEARLTAMETAQKDLLDTLEKSATKGEKGKAKSKGKEKDEERGVEFKNVAALKAAFEKGKHADVVEGAPKIIKSAKSKDKEEATYLYAESLFKTGNFIDSALQFNTFIEMKPKSRDHQSHAKMRLGDCFRARGDVATAKLYYTEVLKEFPNSADARKAKERLAEGGKATSSKSAKAESTDKEKGGEKDVEKDAEREPSVKEDKSKTDSNN